MPSSVAFRAQHGNILTDQQEAVGGAVGHMAAAATFDLLIEVFIDPGPLFFGVTLETGGIFGDYAGLSQAGSLAGSMGGMAIGALDLPLDDLVRVGKVKF